MTVNYIELEQENEKNAWEIVRQSRLVPLWEGIGAKVNLVGSLKIGVMANHHDIDFHIYTQELNMGHSFDVMAQICANLNASACTFINASQTEEECFEWHLSCCDSQNRNWTLDIIQIKAGSKYDGYFENVAQIIKQQMTQAQKELIIKLKAETPKEIKIKGIEYYKAVLQDNIKTLDEMLLWHQNHKTDEIIEW